MKSFFFIVLLLCLFVISFSLNGQGTDNYNHYLTISSQTNPEDFSFMLDELPDDVIGNL